MSYIEGSNPSFSKAVISFWFKVPQAAMDAVAKEEEAFYDQDDPGDPPLFLGLVPLVVFGKEGTSPVRADGKGSSDAQTTSTATHTCVEYAADSTDGITLNMWAWSECHDHTSTRNYYKTTWSYEAKPGKPQEPSFIAVDGDGRLAIKFESAQTGSVTLASVLTSATSKYYTQESADECWTFPAVGYCGEYNDTVVNIGGVCGILIIVAQLIAWRIGTAVADQFIGSGSPRTDHKATQEYGSGPGDAGTGAISCSPATTIAADRWHHVLISVDMTNGSASTGVAAGASYGDPKSHITATSEMYVAVDDKNYKTGAYPFQDTNQVYTGSAGQIAYSYQAARYDDRTMIPVGPVPSYSLGNMSVPAGDIGMPSHGKYVDKIRHCEMAEFQLFTGKTLDTSEESNRRLFLDFKRDANGTVIPDGDGNARLKPVKPAIAEEKLGRPDINMNGSTKWIKGTNKGSGGSFKPIGEIKKYKPDPAIRPPAA